MIFWMILGCRMHSSADKKKAASATMHQTTRTR